MKELHQALRCWSLALLYGKLSIGFGPLPVRRRLCESQRLLPWRFITRQVLHDVALTDAIREAWTTEETDGILRLARQVPLEHSDYLKLLRHQSAPFHRTRVMPQAL